MSDLLNPTAIPSSQTPPENPPAETPPTVGVSPSTLPSVVDKIPHAGVVSTPSTVELATETSAISAIPVVAPEAPTPPKRIFKIGSVQIVEDERMATLPVETIREQLRLLYPQVAHATIRETTEGNTHWVEFLPQPGRKG